MESQETRASLGGTGGQSAPANSNFMRFHNILSSASATGEYTKVANGLFENYLLIRFKDPNLEAVSLGQDWTVFSDVVQQHIALSQDYIFNGYLPFLSVAFHFFFATSSKPQLKYPNTNYEMFLKQQRSTHLLTSLTMGMPPAIKRNVSPALLTTELLPLLNDIIMPTFRPVNTQLYSAREKQQFSDLVDTMISYSLTYIQERGPDAQYTYMLDPNIEEITRFPGLPQRKQLTYSAKQLIAREIGVEKLRRAEHSLTARNPTADVKTEVGSSGSSMPPGAQKDAQSLQSPAFQRKRELVKKPFIPKIKEDPVDLDFFGRRVPSKTGPKKASSKAGPTHPLWFKFNEGFSNAVRRPLRIKDLL